MAFGAGLTRGAQLLTHRTIETLRPAEAPYRVPDQRCTGLAVRVAPSGVKTWDLAYRIRGTGKMRRLSLGRTTDIGLEQARERANELTGAARSGRDLVAGCSRGSRERKVHFRARHETITTFAGEIVHPQSPAIQALKRRGQWRLSPPVDLDGDDLDFENNCCRKPWLRPGFFAHVSGLEIGTKGFKRVFRLDAVDASQEPVARSSGAAIAAGRKVSSADRNRATEAIAAKLTIDPLLRTKDAKQLVSDLNIQLGPYQFRMVWREARRQPKLLPQARAGRPKKSSS